MRIVNVKESRFKSKRVGDKTYLWRQRWLNVPREYKNKRSLVVMSEQELIDILYKDEARKKAREEFLKEIERHKKELDKRYNG